MYEGIVQDLIDELGRLPGVGPKSAQRIAFHIVQTQSFDVTRLAKILLEVRERVRFCVECGNVADGERCNVCRDPRRDRSLICVVEEPKDVAAIERAREYGGLYHVLGGAISPIDGIGPDDLNIRGLMRRLESGEVEEVILATDPNLEGDATAAYLSRLLGAMEVSVSRLASGLPVGGDLEYADEVTLGRAFAGRRRLGGARRPAAAAPGAGLSSQDEDAAGASAPAAAQQQSSAASGLTSEAASGRLSPAPASVEAPAAGQTPRAPIPSGPAWDDEQPRDLPRRPADPRDDRGPRISLGGRPVGNAGPAPRRATDPPTPPEDWAR